MPSRYLKHTYLIIVICITSSVVSQETEKLSWGEVQYRSAEWYGSEEAREIGDNVLLYQHKNGGWLKNINMARELSEEEINQLETDKSQKIGTTIDNGATHTQLRYLARVYSATGDKKYRDSFLRGLDFLFEAQYDNGGWPQFYPIKEGYYEHITYNDGAMIGVMELLRDVAEVKEGYSFVDKKRVQKAKKAIEKGLDVILKTQVKVNGKLSIWCAQHDKDDYSPAKARSYELPSLSGKESTGIVEYMLEIEHPSSAVKRSIRAAVAWFEENKVMGQKVKWIKDPNAPEGVDRIVVEDPNGGPLWGRFNDIKTGRPIFVGRDGIIKSELSQIERERRVNYNYIDNYAEDLLNSKYPKWERKH